MKDIQKIEIESTESIEYFFLVAQVLRSVTEKEMLNSASFLFSFSSIRVKLLSDFRYTNNKLKMQPGLELGLNNQNGRFGSAGLSRCGFTWRGQFI